MLNVIAGNSGASYIINISAIPVQTPVGICQCVCVCEMRAHACVCVCACACVSCCVCVCVCMCACVCVCVYVCVAGAGAPGSGAHMCIVLQVLGLGLGRGLLRSSLFTHPQNLNFANFGQLRSLKINIYITIPETPRRGKNVIYPGWYRKGTVYISGFFSSRPFDWHPCRVIWLKGGVWVPGHKNARNALK